MAAAMSLAVVLTAAAAVVATAYARQLDADFSNSEDVFGALMSRRRNNPNQLLNPRDKFERMPHLRPCSIPQNADSKHFYPDFAECRNQNCPPCEPLRQLYSRSNLAVTPKLHVASLISNISTSQIQTRPISALISTTQKQPMNQENVASESYTNLNRPQIQPRQPWTISHATLNPNNIQVQPRPASVSVISALSSTPIQQAPISLSGAASFNRPLIQNSPSVLSVTSGIVNPQIQPRQPYIISPVLPLPGNCPVYNIITQPEVCPNNPFIGMAQPYQCPLAPIIGGVPVDEIKKIIYGEGHCQSGTECSVSVSELLFRLTLLEDRLRSVVKCETRLRIYADMLAQIKLRVGGTVIGNPGPIGEAGQSGHRGPRGGRGASGKCIKLGPSAEKVGRHGPPGPKGAQGYAGDKVCDCDGKSGDHGFPGYSINGNPGRKGMKGHRGPRGHDYNPMI